jgi:hypothetical protein
MHRQPPCAAQPSRRRSRWRGSRVAALLHRRGPRSIPCGCRLRLSHASMAAAGCCCSKGNDSSNPCHDTRQPAAPLHPNTLRAERHPAACCCGCCLLLRLLPAAAAATYCCDCCSCASCCARTRLQPPPAAASAAACCAQPTCTRHGVEQPPPQMGHPCTAHGNECPYMLKTASFIQVPRCAPSLLHATTNALHKRPTPPHRMTRVHKNAPPCYNDALMK